MLALRLLQIESEPAETVQAIPELLFNVVFGANGFDSTLVDLLNFPAIKREEFDKPVPHFGRYLVCLPSEVCPQWAPTADYRIRSNLGNGKRIVEFLEHLVIATPVPPRLRIRIGS